MTGHLAESTHISPSPAPAHARRRWPRRLLWLLVVVAILAGSAAALLQTDWAAERIRRLIEREASAVLSDGHLTIGHLDGNLLFRMTASGVELFSGDSLVVSVDTVKAEYNLFSFLSGGIRVSNLDLFRPAVIARQRPDSTWDLLNLSQTDTSSTSAATEFRIDRVRVTDGRGAARFLSQQPDSSISVAELNVSARNLYIAGATFESTLDNARAIVVAPIAPDPVALTVNGQFAEDRIICTACRLESSRSKVVVIGDLLFPEGSNLRGNLTLRLDPLALGDVAFILPSVDPDESVVGDASVVGTLDSMSANVSLDFSGGAAAHLQGLVTTGDAGRVKIVGSVEKFDPAVFLATREFSGAINATIDVDLKGRKLAAVEGPVDVRITDTILNGARLRDGQLTGQFQDGVGTIDSRVYLPGVAIEATGSIRPFADTLAYDLRGVFRGARLSRYYAATSEIDSVDTRFDVAGQGSSLDEMIARASIDLTRLTSPRLRLGASHVTADLHRGDMSIGGKIRLRGVANEDAGTLGFDASLAKNGKLWHIGKFGLEVTGLNPQLIEATAPSGLLAGKGTVMGDFATDSLFRATGSFSLSGALGLVTLSAAEVRGSFDAGIGNYDLSVTTNIGNVSARGDVKELDEGFDVTASGSVSDLNLDTLSTTALATRLTGSFHGKSRLRHGGVASLVVTARLARSVVNDQELSNALIEAALADSTLTFDVDVDLPNGGISGQGSVTPFAENIRMHLEDGAFSHIDLGAWLGNEKLATDLNGSMTGDAVGNELSGTFRLKPSRVNRTPLTGGTLQVTSSDSTFRLETMIDMRDAQIRGSVAGTFGQTDTTYQGMVQLRDVDVAGLVGSDSLSSKVNAGCSFVGSNFALPRLEASAFCTGKESQVGKTRIDSLRFEAKLNRDSLAVTSLILESNIGRVTGSGAIPTRAEEASSDAQIDLKLELKDLAPAARLVGARTLSGEGTLTLLIGGSVETPALDAEAALAYLAYDDYRVSSFDGFASAPDFAAGHIIGAVDVGFSVYNAVPVQHTSIEIEKSGDSLVLTADARIDSRRKGSISARYEDQGGLGVVVIDELNLNLDGEIWALSGEASFEIGDRWSVRTFLMFSGDQQIALDGYIEPDGDQNLIITLEQIRLGAFSDLVGYPGVDGTGEGYVVLTGAYNDLQFESNVRVQTLKVYGRDVGEFDLSATYQDAQMEVDAKLSHSSGSALTMKGFVPVRLTMTGLDDLKGTEPIQLEVKSDSVPLAWIRPFLDQSVIDRIDGHLVCDVTIGGTWDEPALSGDAGVSSGRVRLPEFKLDMQSIAGKFRLQGEQLLVDQFRANSKGGTLKATGALGFRSLDDPTFDIDTRLDKFRAISTETYRMTVSGKGKLTGSMIKPIFQGNVSVEESDIYMTEELMADEVDPVKLTDRDLRILERRFGYRVANQDTTTWDFYEALDLSLDAKIGRDVWFRSYANPKMDIEFSGDLTVRKPPLEENTLNGTINVNPSRSRVVQFARKFEITSGTIQFNGIVDEALVDIKAQYVVPSRYGGDEVKIGLAITGQVGDLNLELTSDPQMDTGAMVSYLTTGRPPGEGSVGGSQAAELAVSSLSNLVEGFANSQLGLDVVDIQVNPAAGTYLTVGKYVSPKVYVSLTQPLVTSSSYQVGDAAHQTEATIEYELVSWLVAQIASSRNHLQVNMVWEFAF